MSENWRRIERALNQPMTYVKKKDTGKTLHFLVTGSLGNLYNVSIGEETSCSCPDFSNNKNRCKHQILCLLNEFNVGINNDILHDGRLSFQLSELVESNSQCIEGDDCPICFDEINIKDRSWNCKQCLKSFHKFCIDRWLSLSMISNRYSTCPMCRSLIDGSR